MQTRKRKRFKQSLCMALVLSMIASFTTLFPASASGFDFLSSPSEALTPYSSGLLSRVSTAADYTANQGYSDTCLFLSPHWSMTINGASVPVYGTLVYDYALNRSVVQSYEYIFSNFESGSLDVRMTFATRTITNCSVLPKYNAPSAITDGQTIFTNIDRVGTYTFLINNDSQEYAITLFVRENKDEDTEIQRYKKLYGESNVLAVDKGVYNVDYFPTDYKVVYLKRGVYVGANHLRSVKNAQEESTGQVAEFLNMSCRDSHIVTGYGTIDFNRFD